MTERTCTEPQCERTHMAKGLCGPHYTQAWRKSKGGRRRSDEYYPRQCVTCGQGFDSSRPTGKFCSDACKGVHYSETMRIKCKVPTDHPVMLLIAEARKPKPRLKPDRVDLRTPRECPGCGCHFSPVLHAAAHMVACSQRCSSRLSRRRRRAREHNTLNQWRWSDFMRIARKFGYACAYCGESSGQLEPDHVVPLSRGGSDSVANLLPSCSLCNSDKRDLLLHEWEADRFLRGKPSRRTLIPESDPRFSHLTEAILVVPAA